jgi:hypothetical protein
MNKVAGDDKQMLEGLTIGLQNLQKQGDNASDALKSLAQQISEMGGTAANREKTLADANIERIRKEGNTIEAGVRSWAPTVERFALGFASPMLGGAFDVGLPQPGEKLLQKQGAGQQTEYLEKHESARQSALLQIEGKSTTEKLRTNKEKLTDDLTHIKKMKDAGAITGGVAGRAGFEAISEFTKSQGGAVGMAGAMQQGSVGAYSVIAGAQMAAAGAQDAQAVTDDILSKGFADLIEAVNSIKPDWRKADTAP